ncbi:MAG TPA: NAD(P)H-hydrate dehydratase [Candidatus Methylacidiphilales bacterium]|jgi:NAD(P)H-hydrate epimerase|nr:NAD(P)H-hydrate dehydratase [Candidatus Methylacidiphilales bacterium]
MDVLSVKEMVAREEQAFRSGVTAGALMEAAGEAMSGRIAAIYPHTRIFLVLVGKGNNGGDGLVAARHLANAGRRVQVVLTAPGDELGDLPRAQLAQFHGLFPSPEISPWRDDLDFPGADGVVIDALLGNQARGALRGVVAQVVAKLNAARAARFFRTVALDLPSGLAAFEDEKNCRSPDRDAAVVADVTIAVGFAKDVLVRETLSAWVGRLEVVPWNNIPTQAAARQALVAHELAGLLPRRSALSHKGDFGRLAIVAGSPGFTGAPVLCAQAAVAMGAGLVSVVTRPDASSIVAAHAPPEAMVSGWPKGDDAPAVVANASAIAIGPGLGVDAETVKMLRSVLAVGCPVLIDADGLNALAQNPGLLREARGPVLLTPHPGEMTRLIGRKFDAAERESVARDFVDQHQVTLVLKGTRTLIAAPKQPLSINTTGNPGLSAGGSGDTLSGILGALLAQGLAPLDAARLGVWVHGHAADLVLAERGCEEGLTPTLLSAHLGTALVSLRGQAAAPAGLLERAQGKE